MRAWKARRERKRDRLSSVEERFVRSYENNAWRSTETRSGKGSSLARTRSVRSALPQLVKRLGVESLLDIPCGDFHWMKAVELDLKSYIGADIVPSLIEANAERYGAANRTFVCLDIRCDDLPRADLVLCRDGLIHLSFADIERATRRLVASGSTYLLTTTFTALERNVDKETGRSHLLNLQATPFSWPPPVELLEENAPGGRRAALRKGLGLWKLADLPQGTI